MSTITCFFLRNKKNSDNFQLGKHYIRSYMYMLKDNKPVYDGLLFILLSGIQTDDLFCES